MVWGLVWLGLGWVGLGLPCVLLVLLAMLRASERNTSLSKPTRPTPNTTQNPPTSYTALTFIDFLEALGRVADMKSMSTASDLDEAGYANILEWCAARVGWLLDCFFCCTRNALSQHTNNPPVKPLYLHPTSPIPLHPRALDKERLEGAADQSTGTAAGRISSTGPADPQQRASSTAPDGGGPDAAPAAAPQQPAAPTGGMGSSVPAIFRTRPSARFGAPKPRPLYAKLELLLDLMYRRLYWEPSQPESVFSVDALLRAVRKIDKDLGP